MSEPPLSLAQFGKVEPGHTLRIGAPGATAGRIIAEAFVAQGFRYTNPPGQFPQQLKYGTTCATIAVETISSVFPVFLLSHFWRKLRVLKVRIRILDDSYSSSTLRVDTKVVDGLFPFSLFTTTLEQAISALHAQNITVEMEPLTDSVLENRKPRKRRKER